MDVAFRNRLAQYGQQHVLTFWDELTPAQQARLAAQLREVDLDLLTRLWRGEQAAADWAKLASKAQPPPAIRLGQPHPQFDAAAARRAGEQHLAAGQVGAVLVAGGQGTRLGFDAPKGMFPIGPVSGSTLFQILLEKVAACRERYGVAIPLYLMTSPATHEATVEYLRRVEYFGLPADDVRIFCQGTMPAVDAATGKLLLEAKDSLALSPDGHGGMLAAMVRGGVLDDIGRRGLRTLFYMQVDNPLTQVCDPAFIGYHLLSGSELSTLVAAKSAPREKVGNVVSIDGRVQIIEYSELNPLPDEIVLRTDAAGQPIFWAGNTAIHAIDVDFLKRMAASDMALPFHRAHKKVPYVDDSGRFIEPVEVNAIKFERFIFDLLPWAEQAIVMEIDPAEAFRPVKNAPGEASDTPETVQEAMMALHRRWLRAAGAHVADDVPVEISPRFALDAEQTAARIRPGTVIDRPTYLNG